MSTKADIIWFITQCKGKAVKAVVERAEKEIAEYLANFPKDYEDFVIKINACKDTLNKTADFLNTGARTKYTFDDTFELITKGNWDYGKGTVNRSAYSSFYLRLPQDKGLRSYIKFAYEESKDRTLCTLIDVKVEEYAAVSTEYERIIQTIKGLTPRQGLKFLEGLGFDVSVLKVRPNIKLEKEQEQFNKDLIFVCGDNK